jgi:hypothetical protein
MPDKYVLTAIQNSRVKDKIAGMKYAKFSIKLSGTLLTQEQESV